MFILLEIYLCNVCICTVFVACVCVHVAACHQCKVRAVESLTPEAYRSLGGLRLCKKPGRQVYLFVKTFNFRTTQVTQVNINGINTHPMIQDKGCCRVIWPGDRGKAKCTTVAAVSSLKYKIWIQKNTLKKNCDECNVMTVTMSFHHENTAKQVKSD